MTQSPRVIIRSRKEKLTEDSKFIFPYDQAKLGGTSPLLQDYQQKAWNAYEKSHLPEKTHESWRRSDLKDFMPSRYSLAEISTPKSQTTVVKKIEKQHLSGSLRIRNDGITVILTEDLVERGVVVESIQEAEKNHPSFVQMVAGKVIDPGENIFTAAASAFARFGSVIWIPDGVSLEKPLLIALEGSGKGQAILSHHLIRLGKGSSATIILENSSDPTRENEFMHSGLVEILQEDDSRLTFIELQSWDTSAWTFSFTRAKLRNNASIDWTIGTNGSRFSKSFSDLVLLGEGSSGRISGFYFADGTQHLDHETSQNHLAPNTTSDLLFKGALKESSNTIWRGNIYVAPEAKKTDGYQANRNLILSEHARADSIPGLEILTDDVRCTHGATVGKIDQDQVFYLESRGIPKTEAERLVVEGFFEPVLDRIPLDYIRERFRASIIKKMTAS